MRPFLPIALALLLLTLPAPAQRGGEMFPGMEELQARHVADAKALSKEVFPPLERLNKHGQWKLAWQVPPPFDKGIKSEDAYWAHYAQQAFPSGLSAADATKVLDGLIGMMAGEGGDDARAAGVGPREATLMMLGHARGQSGALSRKVEDEYTAAGAMMAAAAKANAGTERPGPEAQRAAFAAMFAPYQHLDAAKAREAYLRQATLVKRSTTMAYYRANDWAQLATARSERDFVDKKIWLGVVNVTVMLVDPARVAEVEDLTDVPAFEARLNTAFKGMVNGLVQMNKMQIDREVESMLRNANGDPGAVRGAEERKARAAKEHAAAEKATIKVIKREFGANSYVIRMTGISPDTPGLQASVYSGWIRNGNACVRIEFGGNFPEDAMLKEMDHFLSEMDAKTASFGGL